MGGATIGAKETLSRRCKGGDRESKYIVYVHETKAYFTRLFNEILHLLTDYSQLL